jgi:hypothetical protein
LGERGVQWGGGEEGGGARQAEGRERRSEEGELSLPLPIFFFPSSTLPHDKICPAFSKRTNREIISTLRVRRKVVREGTLRLKGQLSLAREDGER